MTSGTIRASEIGSYLYCRRAWWFQSQGYASSNVRELARGAEAHAGYGRAARRLAVMRWVAVGLIGLALLLLLTQA